ncbi:MAG TPA: hypothetical protein VMZ71_18060 [Gemmataceae bacterium]|nr:hypothetical protein [Gemmataceae bacterium]
MPYPKMITAFGKTQSMADWARETGIPYPVLKDRLRPRSRGWTVEEALTRGVDDGVRRDRETEAENGKGQTKFKSWVGRVVGRLTVVEYIPGRKREGVKPLFRCECACGNKDYRVSPYNLLYHDRPDSGCGCIASERMAAMNVERTKHGLAHSPEYKIWAAIIQRCTNTHAQKYADYGGRGITVCARWLESFENFYADMGPRPLPHLTIERRENDLGYSPENCGWDTRKVQANNRRNTIWITARGRKQTISAWAAELGVPYAVIARRQRKGWDDERIISTPLTDRERDSVP